MCLTILLYLLYRHQRFDEALKCIDSHAIRERLMLEKLHQHGDSNYGYVRAIMAIPYTYRSMYTRSMTSLLWNHVASYRIREYGLRPVEGDLVLMERKQDLSRRQAEISDRYVRVELFAFTHFSLFARGFLTIFGCVW